MLNVLENGVKKREKGSKIQETVDVIYEQLFSEELGTVK